MGRSNRFSRHVSIALVIFAQGLRQKTCHLPPEQGHSDFSPATSAPPPGPAQPSRRLSPPQGPPSPPSRPAAQGCPCSALRAQGRAGPGRPAGPRCRRRELCRGARPWRGTAAALCLQTGLLTPSAGTRPAPARPVTRRAGGGSR